MYFITCVFVDRFLFGFVALFFLFSSLSFSLSLSPSRIFSEFFISFQTFSLSLPRSLFFFSWISFEVFCCCCCCLFHEYLLCVFIHNVYIFSWITENFICLYWKFFLASSEFSTCVCYWLDFSVQLDFSLITIIVKGIRNALFPSIHSIEMHCNSSFS